MTDPAAAEGAAYNPTIKVEEKITVEPPEDDEQPEEPTDDVGDEEPE